MRKSKLLLIIFWIVSLNELISIAFEFPAHYLFKPLILIALIGYYLVSTNQWNKQLLSALFFCWIGDFLLMLADQGEFYFILGLLAFLVGHAFYIFTFRKFSWVQASSLLSTQKVRYSFPIFLAGTGLIVILYPGLGTLRFPVIIYAIVLMIMASTALFRVGRTSYASFIWVFVGAINFMISDSLLAIDKFHSPFNFANIYIMVTYISAQYCIVKGLLLHTSNSN